MVKRFDWLRCFSSLVLLLALWLSANAYAQETQPSPQEPIDFATQVLPILSANCFACHGLDEAARQADLRLDREEFVKSEQASGVPVVPGKPEESTLIERVLSSDPNSIMPPPESHKTLSAEQIDTLKRWIEQGANWEEHWAFAPIVRPAGSLDDQVERQLRARGLAFHSAAESHVLVRRLYLDLIGLSPTLEVADAFAKDPSPEHYERLVDDLLASPQFGEHWARMWLDLARYADTKGYEKDLGRTMWPYRDWVIAAFNSDMPLDRFTVEQLAGDLLPGATVSARIATAFHRNTMSNDEGGTDDEEFRIAAVKDRIDTTVQVWMGLTLGCAKCHSHKYDPISMTDYYRFYAVFNQTADADRYDDAPLMEVIDETQLVNRERLKAEIADQRTELQRLIEADLTALESGAWRLGKELSGVARSGAKLEANAAGVFQASGKVADDDIYTIEMSLEPGTWTALRLETFPYMLPDGTIGLGRNPTDPNFVVSEVRLERVATEAEAIKLSEVKADFAQNGWPAEDAIDGDLKTGWAISPRKQERHQAMFILAEPLETTEPIRVRVTLVQNYGNRLVMGRFRLALSSESPATLELDPASAVVQEARQKLVDLEARLQQLNASLVNLPVMQELPSDRRRETRVHTRGNFLDPGEVVEPAALSAFHPLPPGQAANRLSIAHWLVAAENPLTPRVWANRIWSRVMGVGIVETEEDFGALGSPPTNRELLDWLAVEYRDNGWSLKHLLKQIVMSRTYQQSSRASEQHLELDPRNVWHARAPRYRLGAEVVRDQALAVSGLISLKMGGPSVMPPQPEGLWRSTYNGMAWVDAEGEDRYRRGLYTYLKRTTPYPSFINFDSGSGEVCLIRRIRTNTPLQALVTLNDPVYLEASAALASRMIAAADSIEQRAEFGLRTAVIRPLRDDETLPLLELYEQTLSRFNDQPQAAERMLQACRASESPLTAPEHAAWIVVANAILNLDEVLSRR